MPSTADADILGGAKMKNLKVSHKFMVVAAIVFVAMASVGAIGIVGMFSQSGANEEM